MTELWELSAGNLATLIKSRQASSREVVTAHLARIAAVNPKLNAVVSVLNDEALRLAAAADERLARGEDVGPLHGVPFTVKENVDVAGCATTWGMAALAAAVATEDAPAVANLKRAGAILIGRSNMPDLALRWHTDGSAHGATLNPWDPALTPGGSSGGEAVALVTGMSPLGIGNDLGGSLRWPAHCCGVSSLKPTTGRIASATSVPPLDPPLGLQLFNVQGPMARTVADLRLAFGVMARPSARDPWYAPVQAEWPVEGRPLRAAVYEGASADDRVQAALRRAAGALAARGYDVVDEAPPDLAPAAEVWAEVMAVEVAGILQDVAPMLGRDALTFITNAAAALPAAGLAGYSAALVRRHALLRAWLPFLEDTPLVLAPISLRASFPADFDLTPEGPAVMLRALTPAVAVNALGLPAVAVTVGRSDSGLPVAVQVIGPRFREDLCLAAAEVIEAETGPASMRLSPT